MCLPIIGAIISGIGSALGAAATAASYKAQATYQERQAQIEHEAGAVKAKDQSRQVERVLGSQRAEFAARGISSTAGSAQDIYDESAAEGALDVARIRWNSKLASDNYMAQSRISKMNAGLASAAIPFAFASPVISGLATLPKFGST